MQSPSSDDSPNKSPSSPPSDDEVVVPPTEEKEIFLKSPKQVLEELSACDGDGGGDGNSASPGGGGSAVAMAVGVGGDSVVVVEGAAIVRKRKSPEVKDPPRGVPTCPVCEKQFSSWKGAFGHMRKHPEREYRGFYHPPVFNSTSSHPQPPNDDNNNNGDGESSRGKGKSGEIGGGSPIRGLLFDLNLPMERVGSSSSAAADDRNEEAAPVHETIADEENVVNESGNRLRLFDLNEMPTPEDDDHDI